MIRRRNPVAKAPILRKGGVHQKSRSSERAESRKTLRTDIEMALRQLGQVTRGRSSS